MGSQWDWEAPALSHPTLVAVSSRLREKNNKKPSLRLLLVCKINKYGSENIFLNLRSVEKNSGKMGSHSDKQQLWYECDCFKSCAQLACASQVVPLRLISARLFVNLVSGGSSEEAVATDLKVLDSRKT